MRKLSTLLAILSLCSAPLNADVLFFNQGEEIVGKLISIENKKVSFEDLNKNIKVYDESEISSVLISKIRKGDDIDKVENLTDPVAIEVLKNRPDKSVYKDNISATLYRHTYIEYVSDTEVKYSTREITQILKEQGISQANQSFYSFVENETSELEYAHTYSEDGNVYHVTDDAVSEEFLRNSTPEYNKMKRLKIAFKKVNVGSVIDSRFVRNITNLSETSPYSALFVFGEEEPVVKKEVTICFPKGMKIKKVLSQWDQPNAPKFTETEKDGKIIWNFVYSDIEGYVAEQNMMPRRRIFPTLNIYKEDDRQNIANKLCDGYKAARPSEKLLDEFIEKSGALKAATVFEKVSKIYEAVNKDIRDVGMSPQYMGSFLPLPADIALTKKYGNEQAIIALMYYSLEKLGIKSYPGFTDSKRERVTIKDCATLDLVSDPILKVEIDGRNYYTDGGSSYTPFGYLSTGFQGAEACFFDIDKNGWFIETLPVSTFDWNRKDTVIYAKISENGNMEVNQTISPRGPYESSYRHIRGMKEQEKRIYAERWVKSIHPNAILESFGYSNLEDLNLPVVINFKYSIPQAVQKVSDSILTFTNYWTNYSSSSASLKTRKYPMKYWATEEVKKTIIFEMPDGYEWVKWDNQYQHNSPEFTFASGLYSTGKQLVYTDSFVATTDELMTEKSYLNYRDCLLKMAELGNQWIVLEKLENKQESKPESITETKP